MNKVVLIGRLTKDPELTFLSGSGNAVVKFTLAVNRMRQKDKAPEADFINCVCFGKRAEAISSFVYKGHLFGISGRIQVNKYVDKEGQNRWSTDVIVDDFDFLQAKNQSTSSASSNTTSENNFANNVSYTEVDDDDIPF